MKLLLSVAPYKLRLVMRPMRKQQHGRRRVKIIYAFEQPEASLMLGALMTVCLVHANCKGRSVQRGSTDTMAHPAVGRALVVRL